MIDKYVKLDDVIELLNGEIDSLISSNFPYNPIYDYRKTEAEDIKDYVLDLPTVELPHWHDLRKNPEDLPMKENQDWTVDVICIDDKSNYTVGYYDFNNEWWVTQSALDYTFNVIKWMELPKESED